MSAETAHGAELPHLPFYVATPGAPDYLFIGMGIFLVVVVFLFLVVYLNLHSIPERMAHQANHTQLQVVALLALIALFTHNNIFWVAALLLAALQFPDFMTPLESIAKSLQRISGQIGEAPKAPEALPEDTSDEAQVKAAEAPHA